MAKTEQKSNVRVSNTWVIRNESTGQLVESPIKLRQSGSRSELSSYEESDKKERKQGNLKKPTINDGQNEVVRYKRLIQKFEQYYDIMPLFDTLKVLKIKIPKCIVI